MIIKITPDIEKAKSILNIVKSRESFMKQIRKLSYPTIIAENYYEIMKELCTAIVLIDGYKAIGENAHKELIDFMASYKELNEEEILIMQDLRAKRNKNSYEGKQIEKSYIENKEKKLLGIIEKLKKILKKKLEG